MFIEIFSIVLDGLATISAVLYANTNHPELKTDFPNWNERCKQILKKWRVLSTEKKAPYLQKARENRSCMKKAQQVSQFSYYFFLCASQKETTYMTCKCFIGMAELMKL